jgi:acyl-CoA thioester hydrolase
MWHLVFTLGFHRSWLTDRRVGWADVRYEINFCRELRVGQLFYAQSAVVRVGNASLVTLHRIVEAESRELAAEAKITSVYFDLARRTSRPFPAEIRSAAERAPKTFSATDPDPRG